MLDVEIRVRPQNENHLGAFNVAESGYLMGPYKHWWLRDGMFATLIKGEAIDVWTIGQSTFVHLDGVMTSIYWFAVSINRDCCSVKE